MRYLHMMLCVCALIYNLRGAQATSASAPVAASSASSSSSSSSSSYTLPRVIHNAIYDAEGKKRSLFGLNLPSEIEQIAFGEYAEPDMREIIRKRLPELNARLRRETGHEREILIDGAIIAAEWQQSSAWNPTPVNSIGAVSFSPDSRLMATTYRADTTMWDLHHKRSLYTITHEHGHRPRSGLFSADSNRLVVAYLNMARVYDTSAGTFIHEFIIPTGCKAAQLNSDGSRLLITTEMGTAEMWYVDARARLYTITESNHRIASAMFNPDGTMVFTLLAAKGTNQIEALQARDANSGNVIYARAISGNPKLLFSPDGTRFITYHSSEGLYLWSTHDGTLINRIPIKESIASVQFNGTHALVTTNQHRVYLCDVRTRTPQAITLAGGKKPIPSSFSDDLQYMIAVTEDAPDNLRIWRIADRQEMRALNKSYTAIFSPNNQYIGVLNSDTEVVLYEGRKLITISPDDMQRIATFAEVSMGTSSTGASSSSSSSSSSGS